MNNSIISSNTPPMATPTIGVVCICLLERAYFNYLDHQLSLWARNKVVRRKPIIHPTGFGAYSSTCFQWDGKDVSITYP